MIWPRAWTPALSIESAPYSLSLIHIFGASHFIATNHTATGRAHNRRVTITITYLQPID